MSTAPTGTSKPVVHCASEGVQGLHAVPAQPGDIRGEQVTAQAHGAAAPEASRLVRFRIALVGPRLVVPVIARDHPGVADLVADVARKFYGARVAAISRL